MVDNLPLERTGGSIICKGWRVSRRPLNGLTLSTAMQALDYRIPKDDQRVEAPLWPISRSQLNVAFSLGAAVLSAASLFVVFQGANDEPYMGYRRYDAIVQVGVGTALMVLWGVCSIAVVILVGKRKLSPAWLALLLWAAICLFYLSYSPLGARIRGRDSIRKSNCVPLSFPRHPIVSPRLLFVPQVVRALRASGAKLS